MTDLERSTLTVDQWKLGEQRPGSWFPVPAGPNTAYGERIHRGVRVVVIVRCPVCERGMTIANHSIAADGVLAPSLVCPHGCSWHVMARLLDW